MNDIERLEQVPPSLLKASNVTYIVIDGMMLSNSMMIQKAKRIAKEILENQRYLSQTGIEELREIIAL